MNRFALLAACLISLVLAAHDVPPSPRVRQAAACGDLAEGSEGLLIVLGPFRLRVDGQLRRRSRLDWSDRMMPTLRLMEDASLALETSYEEHSFAASGSFRGRQVINPRELLEDLYHLMAWDLTWRSRVMARATARLSVGGCRRRGPAGSHTHDR